MDLNQYLQDLEYLVNTDSCSDDPEGLGKIADFFSTRFRDLGWLVTEHDYAPQGGKLVICTNREAEHYDVMLIGHMDTVFTKGTCAQRPFRMENGIAYGPGVSDMKHGCLLMYYLMKELPQAVMDKLNIVVVFNPDEEIGSRYSKEHYIPYAQKTDYCFLYEACSNSGTACIKRKGAVHLNIQFTGIAGHCGFVFTNGAISAISEMAKWTVELDKLQSRERNTSVNVGVVSGGTKSNVVAQNASMTVDIRFNRPDEPERIQKTVDALLAGARERGVGVEIQRKSKLPLNPTPEAECFAQHMLQIAKENDVQLSFRARGGLSDANIIAQYGPICVDGMGPQGGEGHCDKENMRIDSVEPMFRLSQAVLKDIADKK